LLQADLTYILILVDVYTHAS